jgi:ribonuclease HII
MAVSTRCEARLRKKGYRYIAGIDEVGVGPLAGPVVAAAVILPEGCRIKGIDDSKKLSPKVRQEIYRKIKSRAQAVGVGIVSEKVIDRINIFKAAQRAMRRAIKMLSPQPDYILIDGKNFLRDISIQQLPIPGGDGKCTAIAAASIIAKVDRDRIMERLDKDYPQYSFFKHKGYGTKSHLKALKKFGPCSIHRKSYYPVARWQEIP